MEILVCLEGSPSTQRAIDVALELARTLPAGLVGLAIVDAPDIVAGAATSIGGASYRRERDAALLADAHHHTRAWIGDFLTRGRAAGVAVRALEITGRPAEMILTEVPRHDLTVLGRDVNFRYETQDQDRYTRDRILRRAGRPLIVVPERIASRGSAVLLAFDASSAATRALRSFADARLARGRDVHVATVDDDGARAFEIASRGCALLAELGVRAVPDNVVSSEPTAAALLTRAAKIGAGMIGLGGYIPSPLSRLVWGSVTHQIIERAAVPVFLHY
ncbi:MAG TPA: universal stress protein [Kofleriaceae bacterium]|nr:universal stress protein [Kofleriaceae bacterium]